MQRTLLLARHAEAAPARDDHARPLTDQGRTEAIAVGERLGAVDLALVSSARRTRETLDGIARGADVSRVEVLDAIYEAAPGDILDAVRDVPDDVATLLVVGHSPGIPALVDLLVADGSGPDAARQALARGYAPGTVTSLAVDRPWSELDARQAGLVEVHTPTA